MLREIALSFYSLHLPEQELHAVTQQTNPFCR